MPLIWPLSITHPASAGFFLPNNLEDIVSGDDEHEQDYIGLPYVLLSKIVDDRLLLWIVATIQDLVL